MDDRQPLPPVFKLDDGVDVIGPCAGDNLCLVYDGAGCSGRRFRIKEYHPIGVARRRVDRVLVPAGERERALFDAGLQSFIAFCERLAVVEHKSVEPLAGLIEGLGTAYLVLDNPDGVTLEAWLDELGRPPTREEIETIAKGICEGLAVAHAAELLHLDLSPETILIGDGGQPLLIDFSATAIGFAASAGRDGPAAVPGYASPEREGGDLARMGVHSDVYGAAAIMYRLMTGETPPRAGLRCEGDAVAEKLAAAGRGIPQQLREGVLAGLAPDPAERPASASALHALLREAPAPTMIHTEEEDEPEMSIADPSVSEGTAGTVTSRPFVLAVAAGLLAVAAAAAVNLARPPQDVEVPVAVAVEASDVAALGQASLPLDRAAELSLRPGHTFRECAGCPEMVLIPAGSFTMGSAATEPGHGPDEAPQRKVHLRSPFAMSLTTVMRAEFELFVTSSGYKAARSCRLFEGGKWVERSDRSFRNPGFAQQGDHPVVCVNWSDARAYADWLSSKTGKRYRLPTEAEWEYAARAGTTTPFWWGSSISTYQANYDATLTYGGSRTGDHRERTVSARFFLPNPWGLFQVHGNVSQWVEDCWNAHYRGAPEDGSAWTSGDCTRRVVRGGSWGYAPKDLRSAYREGAGAENRNFTYGLRVVRVIEPET